MRRPGSRSTDDLDAVDVLLVEDEDEDVAADEVRTVLHELAVEAMARRATWSADLGPPAREPDVARPEPVSLARRVARRYRRRAVAGAVLAVAVAATTAVVDARQDAARAAALAATPAVLADASRPPTPVWRAPGRVVGDGHDTLLVVDRGSLRAVDPATGETAWTASAEAGRAASTGHCFAVDEGLRPGRAPVEDGSGPRGLVACVAHVPVPPAGDAPAGARVVVVDTTTGRTRHTVTTDGRLLLAEPVDRDLLLTGALPDGRVRVTRWDLTSGTARWDTVSPGPVLAGGAAAAPERRPGSLTVGDLAVDLATGAELDAALERQEPYPYEEFVLPGGARATWFWRGDGTSGGGRVTGGDAGAWYALPGPPLRPPVTDGSDSGVLVARTAGRDRVRGLDLRTGRMRWTVPAADASALRATALVDGVMLLDDGVTVTALAVRTGEPVWRTRVDAEVTGGDALTDGQVVLLPVRTVDGAVRLVASRIADGTPVWRADAPPGTRSMTVVDHHLVASTDGEVVGLG